MSVFLRLLSGLRLEIDGIPAKGKAAQRRRLAILAMLAASPSGSVSRERLIFHLWPDASPDAGRRLLNESVYVLRRELGEHTITSAGADLVLDRSRLPSDLAALRTAFGVDDCESAMALYEGPFLDGWFLDSAPDFERWVELERDSIKRSYADVLQRSATRLQASGAWPDAIRRWEALYRLDPYSSRGAIQLARALAAAGERAAALQLLGAHGDLLRQDLDIEPDAELLTLERELRDPPAHSAAIDPIRTANEPTAAGDEAPHIAHGTGPTETIENGIRLDPAVVHRRPWHRQARSLFGIGAVLIALFAIQLRAKPDRPSVPDNADRIAVLYLDVSSDLENLRFIANGLTNEIINQLSLNAFDLISANEARAVRDGRLLLDSLVAMRNVGTIVEGTIRTIDGQLEVTVRLIDVNTARHVATGVFARTAQELFALEQDLSKFVATALSQHLRRAVSLREADRGTRDPVARKLVQMADRHREDATLIALQGHPLDREAARHLLETADSLLLRAERLDPKWLRPLIDRGFVARDLGRLQSGSNRQRMLAHGLSLADRAIRESPDNSAALELRGSLRWTIAMSLRGEARDTTTLREAVEDLSRAVAIEPNRASAWLVLSYVQTVRGQPAEGRIAAARALEGDAYLADSQDLYFGLFASALTSDSLPSAERWCLRAQRVHPRDSRFLECELTLLRERSHGPGDVERAWQLVARLDTLDPPRNGRASGYAPIYRRVVAAAVSARAGDTLRARAELAAARRAAVGSRSLSLDLAFDQAYVHLVLGEREEALRLLREVISERPMMQRVIERAPLYRELRDDLTG
jgi:DNA-binding SARP family transcriptional activator/TolB-like protein